MNTSEWHHAVNQYHIGKMGTPDWCGWMYDALKIPTEIPRMVKLFKGSAPLTCCLGVKCRECPQLQALASLDPEAKALTCVAHIIFRGGDKLNEGYLLTDDDISYWEHVHKNLTDSQ